MKTQTTCSALFESFLSCFVLYYFYEFNQKGQNHKKYLYPYVIVHLFAYFIGINESNGSYEELLQYTFLKSVFAT